MSILNKLNLGKTKRTATKTIVIIDDEIERAGIYAGLFKEPNFIVKICKIHDQMADLIIESQPDILIYHILSEKVDPLKIFTQIRKELPAIKIITHSHGASKFEMELLLESGISGHLDRHSTHPNDLRELVIRHL